MMAEPLTLENEIQPLLRACERANFFGTTIFVWEHGRVMDVEVRQRMRLREQVRMAIKRLIGV